MDESFKCECENNTFWYFDQEDKIRCRECFTEYRLNTKEKRYFNSDEKKYEDWE
jgi:hypothetical protein